MKDLLLCWLFFACLFFCSARPRKFYLTKNGNYLRRFLKSFAVGHDELFCPREIEGIAVVVKDKIANLGCGSEYDLCSDNNECEPGLMCCPSGCIYKCVVPRRPKTPIATDWLDEPEALTVGGHSWLIDGEESSDSRVIDCSTSIFPGIEPMLCQTGFKCKIQMQEDTANLIPNRGACIKDTALGSNIVEDSFFPSDVEKPNANAPCIFNGKEVQHGYHDIIGCNSCFCKNGYIYCQVQPCLQGQPGHKSLDG